MWYKSGMGNKITAEYVRSRLDYDPETGVLTWKRKVERTPIDKMWNTRFAGKEANHHNSTGHIQFGFDGKNLLGHRLAWLIVYGEWPTADIDHINGVRDDNRLCNMREATRSQNCCNSKDRSNNTSGYRGVYWRKRQKRWASQIRVAYKSINLGNFRCPIEAARAYDKAALRLHGEFASLNFP